MPRSGSRRFRVALAQMRIVPDPGANISHAIREVEVASRRRADLCVLPELFANRYVGQFADVGRRKRGLPDPETLLGRFREVARKAQIAVVVPFAEDTGRGACYNALALIDRVGAVRAKYRKIHIPDSEGYREDRYFTSGDLGYVVGRIGGVRIGLAICWDQWFPEVSRALALQGAELIVYPSAIGSEIARPRFDSRPDWELVMRAQAIMNRVFVAAVNRVGMEERIRFYGGSFVADPWGHVVARASMARPETRFADLDLSAIRDARTFFGFLDTRRPTTYGVLTRSA